MLYKLVTILIRPCARDGNVLSKVTDPDDDFNFTLEALKHILVVQNSTGAGAGYKISNKARCKMW